MLMYLSRGWRYDFDTPPRKKLPALAYQVDPTDIVTQAKAFTPVIISRDHRPNWEFYAVLQGELNMIPYGAKPPPISYYQHSMWLARPNSRHTWATPLKKHCEILCFHFSAIPPLLQQSIDANGINRVSFQASDIPWLHGVFDHLLPHYRNPNMASPLVFEAGLCDLSAFFLERLPMLKGNTSSAFDPAMHKVNAAIQMFRANLSQRLSVEKVAQAMGISAGHLRQLFQDVYGRSTREMFEKVTMETAKQLLMEPNLSLKEVAARCGYNAYSQFYRAFMRSVGVTPADWIKGKVYGPGNALKV